MITIFKRSAPWINETRLLEKFVKVRLLKIQNNAQCYVITLKSNLDDNALSQHYSPSFMEMNCE